MSLKMSPWSEFRGDWQEPVLRIAAFLKCSPEDLFPPQHIKKALQVNTAEIEASLEDVAAYLPPPADDPEQLLMERDTARVLNEAIIRQLTPRQQRVLELRFGLHGNGEHSYEEIGQQLGITGNRIQQIEKRALKRLRYNPPNRPRLERPWTVTGSISALDAEAHRKEEATAREAAEDEVSQ